MRYTKKHVRFEVLREAAKLSSDLDKPSYNEVLDQSISEAKKKFPGKILVREDYADDVLAILIGVRISRRDNKQ